MIDIQKPAGLAALRGLFAGQPTAFFLEAMIAGSCAFRAWTDGLAEPRSALVWDEHNILFALGELDTAAFRADLTFLLGEIILPQAHARGRDAFLIHASAPQHDALLGEALPGFTLNRYPRVVFEGVAEEMRPDWRKLLPAGFLLRSIDRSLLNETSLEGHEGLSEEIEECWPSRRHFLTMGLGAAILDGRRIACRITGEYFYPGHIGIGIETAERSRGRGLATAATGAFLEMCAERGLAPHWDAWKNNVPSVRVAEKAGFTHPVEYSALVAYLQGEQR